MRLRQFRFAVGGAPTDDQVDRLLDRAGDACVEVVPALGESWVAFDRDAPTLVDAIVSGVRDLDACGIVPVRVAADDDIVSPGVIAERVGRSPDSVHRWVTGRAGPSGFPAPARRHPRRPCYRWSEVVPWLRVHHGFTPPDPTTTLLAVNLALRLRELAPLVERMSAIRALLS